MADNTKIEWAESTWNITTGCTPISEGCQICYAEKMAHRLHAIGMPGYENEFKPTCHPDRMDQPTRWKKPRKVFVSSMGDLFHKQIPDAFLDQVYRQMVANPRHIFQVLTKRPGRMGRFLRARKIHEQGFPHIYHGTTIENQRAADRRIPMLIDCPSTVRFLSCEPLLEDVDLGLGNGGNGGISWVIVGGESGPGARYMDHSWVRNVIQQCDVAGVKVFVKQFGSAWAKDRGERGKAKDMSKWPKWARRREVPWED